MTSNGVSRTSGVVTMTDFGVDNDDLDFYATMSLRDDNHGAITIVDKRSNTKAFSAPLETCIQLNTLLTAAIETLRETTVHGSGYSDEVGELLPGDLLASDAEPQAE